MQDKNPEIFVVRVRPGGMIIKEIDGPFDYDTHEVQCALSAHIAHLKLTPDDMIEALFTAGEPECLTHEHLGTGLYAVTDGQSVIRLETLD